MKKSDKRDKAYHIRREIMSIVTRGGHDVKVSLPSLLHEAIRDKLWKQLTKADGSRYRDVVEWLEDGHPNGCMVGAASHYFTRAEVARLIEDLGKNKDRTSLLKMLQPTDSRRNANGKRTSNGSPQPAAEKCSEKQILANLLERDHPGFWQGYLNGTYRSVHAAAVAAGIRQDGHNPVKRVKSYWRRATAAERREIRNWLRSKDARRKN